MESLMDDMTKLGLIGSELMSNRLYENVNLHPDLQYHGTKSAEDGKYSTLSAINSSKGSNYINPVELSNKLHIGLKTSARTLKGTTSQFICSTDSLVRRFRNDKG